MTTTSCENRLDSHVAKVKKEIEHQSKGTTKTTAFCEGNHVAKVGGIIDNHKPSVAIVLLYKNIWYSLFDIYGFLYLGLLNDTSEAKFK